MISGEFSVKNQAESTFNYEEFRESLIPEWQEIADRLTQTPKGSVDLNSSRLREGILESSQTIADIDSLVSGQDANPHDYSYLTLRRMYYNLPPLLDLGKRTHIFDFLARGLDSEPSYLTSKGEHKKAMLRSRRLASIYEELSVLNAEPNGESASRALELNQQVSQTEHLGIGKSPRKLHARFAIYDISLRSLTNNYEAKRSTETDSAYSTALELHFLELAEVIATTRSIFPGEGSVIGEIGELVLQGRIKDRLFSTGKHLDIEATQGFIREDHSHELFGKKLSFDLKLINHRTGRVQPIEVKKLTEGSDINGTPNKYLAPIDVARFRLGLNTRDFLAITEQYCRDKVRQLGGRQDRQSDSGIIRSVEAIIDPEITRQFIRLNADTETSTNYCNGISGRYPTIYGFVPTGASNT